MEFINEIFSIDKDTTAILVSRSAISVYVTFDQYN